MTEGSGALTKGLRATLAAAALACSAVAGAAEGAGPPVPDWKQSHLEQGDPAVVSLYILAICARNHKREAVDAFLAAEPGSAEEAALLATIVPAGTTDCPIRAGKLRIRGSAMVRGALSEAVYNGDRIKPRGPGPLPEAGGPAPTASTSAFGVASRVARCAVRRSPVLAHDLMKYNYGSPTETRALQALAPAFTACLGPGERLAVPRINMRLLVAQELYRAATTFREAFTRG
ncbi:MAG: hypothetical protein JOZ90_05765 [Alphaproteobacteria bacterium]|nr:hypothetical protein [Alphaproteobacteria bacterium]MBV9373384.1 hypothetical protein [Alphaproteobacteria bacterium]MBV9900588.1 hypothetical protein [Alphaproteobacteria bacterium]